MKKAFNYLNRFMPFVLVFVVVFTASFVFNRAFKIEYLTGDDLNTYYVFKKVNFFKFVFEKSPGRFRPISSVFLWLQYCICGNNVTMIQWYNIFAMSFFSSLIFLMLYSMSHCYVESLIAVFLITVSRFSWYNVTQVYGRMENICILLVVVGLWSLSRYKDSGRNLYLGITIASYILVMFGHERYFLLFIPYALFYLVHSNGWKKYAYSLSFIVFFSIYYLFKVNILKIGFSADTGGSSEVSFSFLGALKNAIYALVNTLELPLAEDYLVGYNYSMMTESIQTMAIVLTLMNGLLLLFTIIILVMKLVKEGVKSFISIEFIVLLSCILMIGPAAVAQRMEMRFIYCSFILLTMVFVFNIRIIRSYIYRFVLSAILIMGIVFGNIMVKNASPYYYIIQFEAEANTYYNSLYLPYVDYVENRRICYYMDTNVDSARNFLSQYDYPNGVDFLNTSDIQEYFNSLSASEAYNTLFIHVNSSFETDMLDIETGQYVELYDWVLGSSYTYLFINNNLSISYFIPESFKGVIYNIYVDGVKIDKLDDHYESKDYTYTYSMESLNYKMHTFTIEIDDSNLPENYRGNDIRELMAYILYIKCFG